MGAFKEGSCDVLVFLAIAVSPFFCVSLFHVFGVVVQGLWPLTMMYCKCGVCFVAHLSLCGEITFLWTYGWCIVRVVWLAEFGGCCQEVLAILRFCLLLVCVLIVELAHVLIFVFVASIMFQADFLRANNEYS